MQEQDGHKMSDDGIIKDQHFFKIQLLFQILLQFQQNRRPHSKKRKQIVLVISHGFVALRG